MTTTARYDAAQFPKPSLPALPVLSSLKLNRTASNTIPAGVLTCTHRVHLYSGRYAIFLALQCANIGAGDRILVPAYHCLAMIEPLRLSGVEPVYYPLNADLSVTVTELSKRIDQNVKAIIVVHYFGFPQNFQAIRHLADQYHLIMLEDCAHTCFGQKEGIGVGHLGDYAIASTMKFYPSVHGGILASAHHELKTDGLKQPSFAVEVKTLINGLELAHQYGRLAYFGKLLKMIAWLKLLVFKLKSPSTNKVISANKTNQNPPPEYAMSPAWLGCQASRVSQFFMQQTRINDLVQMRQAHYDQFLAALQNRSDCRPLYPIRTPESVPQVFPLYVNNCLPVFVQLKKQGVPIIRFGEFLDDAVTGNTCQVSLDYAEHVLQFPCHQSLSKVEVKWIIARLILALDANSDI
ncbi:aminotransferase class I/II-fold pyridoxal phosphate-dependent enzyme [Chromatium okenii]|uniref:aminotransferase class I/II-fold pyridoxal phosphate-dependent enzyme n=1 Tax=Chromatium okenii TaxID=61644 RepID=UPI001902C956